MSLSIDRIISGKLRQNGYLVHRHDAAAIIVDPGENVEAYVTAIEEKNLRPVAILNTHGHYDHVGAVSPLMARYDIPFYMDGADARILRSANIFRYQFEAKEPIEIPTITHDLAAIDGSFSLAGLTVTNLATPGHTPGGRCFVIDDQMFTGDTLFRTNVGRTDLYGGDEDALAESLKSLMLLNPETVFHPGHGLPSTLGEEIKTNRPLQDYVAKEHSHFRLQES